MCDNEDNHKDKYTVHDEDQEKDKNYDEYDNEDEY